MFIGSHTWSSHDVDISRHSDCVLGLGWLRLSALSAPTLSVASANPGRWLFLARDSSKSFGLHLVRSIYLFFSP